MAAMRRPAAIGPGGKKMRSMMLMAITAAALTLATAGAAEAGCYRMGLSGYHWYRFCVGPRFLYPHHRQCEGRGRYRHCWVD
jgi:opacity protein-like surface antigen